MGWASKRQQSRALKDVKPTEEATASPLGAVIPAAIGEPAVSFTQMVCDRMSTGETLRAICRRLGRPTTTVWKALHRTPEERERCARAREAQAHALAESVIEIADDGSNDTYVDEAGNVRVNHEHIARSKLRVDARKWLASKVLPRVYGDGNKANVNVAVSNEGRPGGLDGMIMTDEMLTALQERRRIALQNSQSFSRKVIDGSHPGVEPSAA